MRFYHVKHFFTDLGFYLRTGQSWHEVKYDLRAQWDELTSPLWSFVHGLRNLRAYFPIIWNDADFDQCYLLELMEFKLGRMAKLHQNTGHLQRCLTTAKQLRVASELCRRVRVDEYCELAYARHREKWGTGWPPETIQPKEAKEYRVIMEHEAYMQKQDLVYLGKLFAKHCLTWWD